MKEDLLFSVIISTCERPALLGLCLDRIAPGVQTILPELYEIIVTDDGIQEVEKMILDHYPYVKWIRGPKRGPAANRNNGARHARGKWLVFTDDDCLPTENWLEGYYNPIKELGNTVKALEGSIYPDRPYNTDVEECPVNLHGGCFWSANIAVEKEIFFKVNGFDENYPTAAMEDIDLYYLLSGVTSLKFVPEAKVIHPVRQINFWKDLKKNIFSIKIWVYHVLKHRNRYGYKGKLDIMLASLVFYSKDFIKNIINGKPRTAAKRLYFILIGIPILIITLYRINNKR